MDAVQCLSSKTDSKHFASQLSTQDGIMEAVAELKK
jgi:hypothetical protein